MDHDEFLDAYRQIIYAAVRKLRPDRFACFVVGDFRDRDGCYRNFPGQTIQAFEADGARLYNEAIPVTAVGSLPIRVPAAASPPEGGAQTAPARVARDLGWAEAGDDLHHRAGARAPALAAGESPGSASGASVMLGSAGDVFVGAALSSMADIGASRTAL